MKNKEFIDKLKHIASLPTVYYSVSGGDWAKWNGKSWNFDCVILIKAILWGWCEDKNHAHGGAKYLSNGVKDVDANGLFNLCSQKTTDFSNIEVGEILWCPGHVGVYIGDRQVIEATAAWDKKVQYSTVGYAGERHKNGNYSVKWTHHGKLPYITYEETKKDDSKERTKEMQSVLNKQYNCGLEVDGIIGPLTTNAINKNYLYKGKNAPIHTKWLQTRLVELDYSVGSYGIDGVFGNDTETAVRKFQTDQKIGVDGIVGIETHKKLVE